MKRFVLSLVLAFLVLAGGPLGADAGSTLAAPIRGVTVVDDAGFHVTFAHSPKRIITLYSAYTEMVFALGLEKRVVGDASQYAEGATGITNAAGKPRDFRYPSEWPSKVGRDYPIKSVSLTHVEGGFGDTPFNLETITSLRPDVIFAPYYKSEIPTFDKMKSLGFKVVFLNPSNVNGIYHDISLVGTVTGTTTQANAVLAAMKADLAGAKSKLSGVSTRPRVFYEVDATNPTQPITAGPKTVIDQAIALADGRNIADSVTSCSGTECYPAFNLEALVAANPQVIVLSDAAYGTSADDVKNRPGWSTIAAVQGGKIFPFNPDLLSRFGPRVAIGIRDLAKLLHPARFKG